MTDKAAGAGSEKPVLKKAMILAAGFGTRLKPLTDSLPKALIEYHGRPMIEHVIIKLKDFGITEIVINTHHLAEKFEDFFSSKDFGVRISLINEPRIFGTGGGIKNAAGYLKDEENFLVYNTDVNSGIDLGEMAMFHSTGEAEATLAVKHRESARALLMDENHSLAGRLSNGEKILCVNNGGELQPVTFCGVHVLSNRIFSYFPADENFDIISVYMNMVKQGRKILCYDICDSEWEDMGTLDALKKY